MSHSKQQTPAVPFNRITLTPVQAASMEEPEGLLLVDQQGDVLARVSLNELLDPAQNALMLDARRDALAILQFLDSVIVRDDETLELQPDDQLGLRLIFDKMQDLLTAGAA